MDVTTIGAPPRTPGLGSEIVGSAPRGSSPHDVRPRGLPQAGARPQGQAAARSLREPCTRTPPCDRSETGRRDEMTPKPQPCQEEPRRVEYTGEHTYRPGPEGRRGIQPDPATSTMTADNLAGASSQRGVPWMGPRQPRGGDSA